MLFTVADLFETVVPFVDPALASPTAVTNITRINKNLPLELFAHGGFESHLGTDDRDVDWMLCVEGDAGRDALAGRAPGAGFPSFLFADPTWRQIREFAIHWADPASPLHEPISQLYLEFDQATFAAEIPVPSVFFNVVKEPARSSSEAPVDDDVHGRYEWICKSGLPCLSGRPLEKEVERKVRNCIDSLPDGAYITYAALMLSRDIQAARLVVSIPDELLAEYLHEIRWPGETDRLVELVEDLSGCVEKATYVLSITDTALPEIGIECHLRKGFPMIEPRWRELLERLVERDLCSPRERDALLAWPGHTCTCLPGHLHPSHVFRVISHIKLVAHGGPSIRAKGYWGFFALSEVDFNRMKSSRL